MTNDEAAQLLLRASGVDGRKAGELQARMWGHLLRDLDITDAMEAVDEHYANSDKWLMPVHVLDGVKRIRAQRLGRTRRAELDAQIARENDGDFDPEPVESGGPGVPLQITSGPLHERLDDYYEGRRIARERQAEREAEQQRLDAVKAERRAKRAEIEAELASVRARQPSPEASNEEAVN
jgi:hypothetical protein